MLQHRLALDRSLRRIDADGHLHVEKNNISKANICGYLGREIPNAEALGLDMNKVYRLLRDPEELRKATGTFCNKPLLMHHVPISADAPSKDLWVGTIGSDVAFDGKYLTADLAVWDSAAIKRIESDEQSELSCGYRYTADMTPGNFEGRAYDGVMRNLVANHVALVKEGRAGSDVHVHDEIPPELTTMKFSKLLAALKTAGVFKPDVDLVALDAALIEAGVEIAEDDGLTPAERMEAEADARKAAGLAADAELCDADKKKAYKAKKMAKDKTVPNAAAGNKNFEGAKDGVTPDQMRLAIDAATKDAVKIATDRVNALHKARKDVEPLVGIVALDSAEEVYTFALKHIGYDTAGIHDSALPSLVDMAIKSRSKAPVSGANPARMVMDSKAPRLGEIFGGAARLNG